MYIFLPQMLLLFLLFPLTYFLCLFSTQIIQDRVDSLVSRNRLLWNSLPGGLYALPQYSTDPAQFPFYYAILGKCLSHQIRSLICLVIIGCFTSSFCLNTTSWKWHKISHDGSAGTLQKCLLMCTVHLTLNDIIQKIPQNFKHVGTWLSQFYPKTHTQTWYTYF